MGLIVYALVKMGCLPFTESSFHTGVASGQPHHAAVRHHGNTGIMRERRAAGDPYWSYSGSTLGLLWLDTPVQRLEGKEQSHVVMVPRQKELCLLEGWALDRCANMAAEVLCLGRGILILHDVSRWQQPI
ncbi:hypothetical protein PAMP_017472 [Pampus punctatissimus]